MFVTCSSQHARVSELGFFSLKELSLLDQVVLVSVVHQAVVRVGAT